MSLGTAVFAVLTFQWFGLSCRDEGSESKAVLPENRFSTSLDVTARTKSPVLQVSLIFMSFWLGLLW